MRGESDCPIWTKKSRPAHDFCPPGTIFVHRARLLSTWRNWFHWDTISFCHHTVLPPPLYNFRQIESQKESQSTIIITRDPFTQEPISTRVTHSAKHRPSSPPLPLLANRVPESISVNHNYNAGSELTSTQVTSGGAIN